MKNILFLISLMLLAAGCVSQNDGTGVVRPVSAAGIRGEEIVQAVIEADYSKFAKAAEELPDIPEKEKMEFQKSCRRLTESYGVPGSFRSLGELKTPLLINQLYAVCFVRKNKEGKKIEHEQLFQVVFGQENNKLKLLGMRFI